MPRGTNPKSAGRPTSCIFCGEGPLSDEDPFPRWFRRYFQMIRNDSQMAHISKFIGPDKVMTDLEPMVTTRQGHPISKMKVHVVCQRCNNGWMSGLQSEAKPIFVEAMSDWPVLGIKEQRTLSAWATMFTMVINFDDMRLQSISPKELQEFRETQTPPANWLVFVTRFEGRYAQTGLYHLGLRLNDVKNAKGPPADWNPALAKLDTQVTTLAFGKLAIQTFSSTSAKMDRFVSEFEYPASLGVRRIFPMTEPLINALPHSVGTAPSSRSGKLPSRLSPATSSSHRAIFASASRLRFCSSLAILCRSTWFGSAGLVCAIATRFVGPLARNILHLTMSGDPGTAQRCLHAALRFLLAIIVGFRLSIRQFFALQRWLGRRDSNPCRTA